MTDYCVYLQLQPEGVADCRFGAVGHPLDGSLAEAVVPLTPVLPLHIVRVGLELRVQVGEVGLVAALRHVALLRQQLQQTPRRPLDQLQAPAVVREADVRELDLLGRVLQTENMNFIDSNNILRKKTIFNH